MGRQRVSLAPEVLACLASPSEHLHKTSKVQVVWRAGCGVAHHKLKLTVEAVCKQHDAFAALNGRGSGFRMPCAYCAVGTKPMSALQRAAMDVVCQVWPGMDIHFDVCIPGSGCRSSADALVGNIMFMVDGEGHFEGIRSQRAVDSEWVDRRFELAAWSHGYGVVRLHARNTRVEWCRTLLAARAWAPRPFILFSPFYHGSLGLEDCVRAGDVPARYAALIQAASERRGEGEKREGHNRTRKGYCNAT
jgi:hypothetical protein